MIIRLGIIIMKVILRRAKNKRDNASNTIVRQAYNNMVKNFEGTILYLNVLKNKK